MPKHTPTLFKLAEMLPGGDLGEIFFWCAAKTPPEGERGGARAIPTGSPAIGGKLLKKKTQYPQAKVPSYQILGPEMSSQTFTGAFDDRYNYPGFAVEEMRRFEDMARRGNVVRLTFDAQDFYGIIDDWSFPYRRAAYIGYTFTVDIANRPSVTNNKTSVDGLPTPSKAVSDAQALALIIGQAAARKPVGVLGTINDALANVDSRIDKLSESLDVRTGVLKPLNDLRKTATMFRQLQGDCSQTIGQLVAAKSTIQMAGRSARDVVLFDAWLRSTLTQTRLLRGHARKSSADLQTRNEGPTARYYHPRAGQSLYDISREVYGTPFNWLRIYQKNNLSAITLTGNEVLIIPEANV